MRRIDLSTLDGIDGFKLIGGGGRVSGIGDINSDGFDDLINDGVVIFGKPGDFSAAIDPSRLDGSDGFLIDGATSSNLPTPVISRMRKRPSV